MEYNKESYSHKWTALMDFLEESYNKAVQEKLLLASINSKDSLIGANAGVAAAIVDRDVSSIDGDGLGKEAERKKRYEESRKKAGKCPLCKLSILLKLD